MTETLAELGGACQGERMMGRYRVLMIASVYTGMKRFFYEGSDTTEGMPAFANTLESYLAEGHEIHLIAICKRQLAPRVRKGLVVHECRQGNGRLGIAAACLRAVVIGLGLARRRRFDLIYGHGEHGALAGVLSVVLRIPNLRRIYGTFLYSELQPPTWSRRLSIAFRHPLVWLGFVLPSAGLIITDDGTKGADVARLLGCSSDRVYFWRNGIDLGAVKRTGQTPPGDLLARHNIPAGRPLLISVSRLEKWKGVDRAVRCLRHVEHKPSPVLVVVGDGSQMGSLKRLAAEEGVSQDVFFVGSLSHEETLCLIRLSDISVCFYDYSNLGNVLIESMALGKCVVSVADGSLDGIIANGENGVLVDTFDAKAIGAIVDRLLCDRRLMTTLGERAGETAGRLFESWEARMDREARLVDAIVAVRGGVRS